MTGKKRSTALGYDRFLLEAGAGLPGFPSEPSIELGLAVKQIRLRMGMTQEELARDARMKPSALKTLENGYAKFTTASNLEAVSRALRIPVREILTEAREWFPGNFFVSKLKPAEALGGSSGRRKKLRQETWWKKKTLSFGDFQANFVSPPVLSPAHFSFVLIEIAPGRAVLNLKLRYPNQVAGFVQRGAARIVYDRAKEADVFGNQGFILRGDKPHDLINADRDNPLRLALAFSLAPSSPSPAIPAAKPASPGLSVGRAVRTIRRLYSHSKTRPISFSELADLTGLEDKALSYLEKTTGTDQVIYWDKIERITQALKMPLSRFLDLAEGKDEGYFYLATAHDRALIDYRHYLGVRIKSTLFPHTGNRFHISETYVEPKRGIRRASWKRSDHAMIAVLVEDGELRIEVGKNRKASLAAGESVYFDASLGYIFTNPGTKPAKLLMAACPPVIF